MATISIDLDTMKNSISKIVENGEEIEQNLYSIETVIRTMKKYWQTPSYNDVANIYNNEILNLTNVVEYTRYLLPKALSDIFAKYSDAEGISIENIDVLPASNIPFGKILTFPDDMDDITINTDNLEDDLNTIKDSLNSAKNNIEEIETAIKEIEWESEAAETFREKIEDDSYNVKDYIYNFKDSIEVVLNNTVQNILDTEKNIDNLI